MVSAFLTQFAAGLCLAIAMSDIRRSSWKFLRLIGIVAVALAFPGMLLLANGAGWSPDVVFSAPSLLSVAGVAVAVVWLFVNAAQQEHVTSAQRILPAAAGVLLLIAAVLLTVAPDTLLAAPAAPGDATPAAAGSGAMATAAAARAIVNTILSALLMGVLTAAMLLGHRYLTDTGMPIAPLRRLTTIYLAVFVVRAAWSIANVLPVWLTDFQPRESLLFFQVALYTRLGVGLAAVAVFAWMARDCVRRRATQSATAMFYLSMVLVFIGELAGQFLMRTEGLAV